MTPAGLVFIELDLDRLLALVLFRVPSDPYGKDRIITIHEIANATILVEVCCCMMKFHSDIRRNHDARSFLPRFSTIVQSNYLRGFISILRLFNYSQYCKRTAWCTHRKRDVDRNVRC